MTPVKVEDIDKQLGLEWAPIEAKSAALVVVNAWIRKQTSNSIPDGFNQDVIDAAACIAPMAASNELFKETEREILSKRVDAKGVGVSKSFAQGSVARSAEENTALAILSAYTGGARSRFIERW